MNLPAHRIRYSRSDYLALEASSNVKHEFLDGQIYGMAGGTPEHAALKAAVTGLLFAQSMTGETSSSTTSTSRRSSSTS